MKNRQKVNLKRFRTKALGLISDAYKHNGFPTPKPGEYGFVLSLDAKLITHTMQVFPMGRGTNKNK